jgi:hypothetical protein
MEVVFTNEDRVLDLETDDPHGVDVAETLVDALGADDPNEVERRLKALGSDVRVARRRGRGR